MLLKSFLKSSQLEIVLTKRYMSCLYLLFGLVICVWWWGMSKQFIEAYMELGVFDVTPTEFFLIDTFAFFPLLLVGCYMIRGVIQQIRLHYWFKNQVNIPQYSSSYSPAMAGYAIDYEFGLKEAYALLLDLHFRDIITLSSTPGSVSVRLNTIDDTVAMYEKVFLELLFATNQTIELDTPVSMRLIEAAEVSQVYLISQMQRQGTIPTTRKLHKVFRSLARYIFWVAGIIGLSVAYDYIFRYDIISVILYPRYPIHMIQLWLHTLLTLLGLIVLVSGFRPRFIQGEKHLFFRSWLEAAGFKQYLQQVYKDRLHPNNIRLQDASTVKTITPYMIAFGLIPFTHAYLNDILAASSRATNGDEKNLS
jgi:hypothetical protein